MLGRLVLIVFQLAVAWRLTGEIPRVLSLVPFKFTPFVEIFLYALAFAIIVWVIGILGALVLKDVPSPTPSTLIFAIVGACLFAALSLFPEVRDAVAKVVRLQQTFYPLVGAVVGYAVKR